MMNYRYVNAAGLVLLLLVAAVHAWVTTTQPQKIFLTRRFVSSSSSANPETPIPFDGQNLCWEDLYDDDCVMTNAAAARFVAADWIKSMPCGQGIQVRIFLVGMSVSWRLEMDTILSHVEKLLFYYYFPNRNRTVTCPRI